MARAPSVSEAIGSLEAAEAAYRRVAGEMEALRADELLALNVDVVSATSIILGAADRILTFRPRLAQLIEFEIRHVDNLKDYAIAAWYVHISNLPAPEPPDAAALFQEVVALREKLLRWAEPLAAEGVFQREVIDKIKQGSGHKDAVGDLVALVGLYRSKWEAAKNNCGVHEADLERGVLIGPRVFSLLSQRDNRRAMPRAEASLRVRRAWTLPDRAYTQCRRALAYLRFAEGDVDVIAPNVRSNPGPRAASVTRSTDAASNHS